MTINWEVIVMLYEHREYGGRKCPILESTSRLSLYDFNDKPSSIRVFPGPRYNPLYHTYRIKCYENDSWGGDPFLLEEEHQGEYPVLEDFHFNDRISSIRIETLNRRSSWTLTAPPIEPIPVFVQLYEHQNYRGKRLNVIEDIANLGSYNGFNDITSSVRVRQGPNYQWIGPSNSLNSRAHLFEDANFQMSKLVLPTDDQNIGQVPPGPPSTPKEGFWYPDLDDFFMKYGYDSVTRMYKISWNDKLSSIKITGP